MTERMSGAENRARRQQKQAAGFDAIGSRYDEVFPLPFLGLPLRVTGWPREQPRTVVESAGFEVQAEDVRVYDPPAPDVPPEMQLFLLAKRT
jgi:hypothetical protein